MTYRCGACDTPAEFDHDQHCILFDDYQPEDHQKIRKQLYGNTRPVDYGKEYKINIASGEDVVCG